MSTEPTGGLSRRTWRAAVVVFLVVFLGGLGVSGSNALWSQSSQVTASVTTGTWTSKPQPGWTMDLDVVAQGSTYWSWSGYQTDLKTSWTVPAGTEGASSLSYTVTVTAYRNKLAMKSVTQDVRTKTSASMNLTTGAMPTHLMLSITPIQDGVKGAPIVTTLTYQDRPRPRDQTPAAEDETTPRPFSNE